MSFPATPIGQEMELDRRNPVGWYLIAALAILMIGSQLASYLNRTPSVAIMRSEIENELQSWIATEAIPGLKPSVGPLAKADRDLEPMLAGDPETTMLYAAVRTEEHRPVEAGKLSALRFSKDPGYQAAYRIYSSPTLDEATAESLAKKTPATSFLYKLVAAHAFEKAGNSGPRKALAGATNGGSLAITGGILAALFLVGLSLLFVYFAARALDRLSPKGLALGNLTGPDADRLALRSAQILVGFLASAIVVGVSVPKAFSDLASYLAAAIFVAYVATVPAGGKLISWRSLGVTRDDLGKHILWGIGGAVANLPIIALVTWIGSLVFSSLPSAEHPVTVDLTNASSPWTILKYLVIASIFVPVIEETMFRGTLFPALASVFKSPIWAGLLSSILFAAIHPTGIPAWPGLAAIGGMSCFLAYQTKSLVPSMVMHCVHNFAVLAFTVFLMR